MRNTKPKIIILPPVETGTRVKKLESKLSAFQVINFKGRAVRQAQRSLMTRDLSKQVKALADEFYGRMLLAATTRHGGLNA